MQDALLKNLTEMGLVKKHSTNRLIVAYSGGIDSTVLLHALAGLRDQLKLELYAAYVHHNWRPLPIKELPLLHKTCRSWNIPLTLIESDRSTQQSEGGGRTHRYNQLSALATDLDADAVLTAHHADDQIETILFRIFRGTGADGLVGIQKKLTYANTKNQKAIVARPMLDIAQSAIEQYAENNQLDYFKDPTNQDVKYHRNLIRKEIIPTLESHFPQIKNSLFKLGLVIEGDIDIIKEDINAQWPDVAKTDDEGLYLDMTAFSNYDLPRRRRLLRRFLQKNNADISFQMIEEILEFIGGEFRQNLSTGLKSLDSDTEGNERFISLYNHRLRVIAPKKFDEGEKPVTEIPLDQAVHLPDYGISIEIQTLKKRPSWTVENRQSHISTNNNPNLLPTKFRRADFTYDVYLDHLIFDDDDLLKPTAIQMRTRQNGDRFFQQGMDCPMRLKKYFINKRIPRFNRDFIPLLAFEDKVLWIQDHGMSEEIRATELYPPTHRIKIKMTTDPILEETEDDEEESAVAVKVPVEALVSAPLDEEELAELLDADDLETEDESFNDDSEKFELEDAESDEDSLEIPDTISMEDERFKDLDVDDIDTLDEEE